MPGSGARIIYVIIIFTNIDTILEFSFLFILLSAAAVSSFLEGVKKVYK